MLNESLLIKRLQAKDNIAFQELINEFGPRLLQTAKLLTSNEQAAEELVCDTFANAFLGINKFKQESSLFSWLYRILFNKFYYQLRQRKREVVIKPSFRDMAPTADSSDLEQEALKLFRQYLPQALSRIPYNQREVILLKYMEDKKLKEIAKILKIPEGTAKTRLHKAIINSRKILKDMNFLPGGAS